MSVVSPPEPPRPGELEALIREARSRQLRRRLGVAALVALIAGGAIAAHSIAGGRTVRSEPPGASRPIAPAGNACGVRVARTAILDGKGRVLYREPVARTFLRAGHEMQCAGSSIWVVFFNGVASSQEQYFGVHSANGGRAWHAVFTERYFGMKAPHQLVTGYLGPWTLDGPRNAYFTGMCVACGYGTVALWVTRDAGRTFHRYNVPALTGYGPFAVRALGSAVVVVRARRGSYKTGPLRKTVKVRVA